MPTHLFRAVAAGFCLLAAVASAGCPKVADSSNGGNNFLTADKSFFIHGIDTYPGTIGATNTSEIVVVHVTYSNPESNAEVITPSRFGLIDLTTQTTYMGLSGGDINVPSMTDTTLDAGKSIDLNIGFRVPPTMTSARLFYREL